jgi:hypothetical protein
MARVEVHQADAGIFHLCAADAVRCVVNLVRQPFIAARLEVFRPCLFWLALLRFWRTLLRFWYVMVCRITVLGDRIGILVCIIDSLAREVRRASGKNRSGRLLYGSCFFTSSSIAFV